MPKRMQEGNPMNHFTPFIPAAAMSRGTPRPKSSSRDVESRLLEAMRMRQKMQDLATALTLLALSFGLTFAAALQVAS